MIRDYVRLILKIVRRKYPKYMRTEKTKEIIKHFLETLSQPLPKKLTSWEANFIESLSNQFDHKGTLSDKQFEILERIYTEKSA